MAQLTQIAITVSCIYMLSGGVTSLECYECSSLQTEKCGITWGFEGNQGDQYKVQCHDDASACTKYVNLEFGSDVPVVYRYCRNHSTVVEYRPSGCTVYKRGTGEICYCSDSNRPCNRNSRATVSSWIVLGGVCLGGLLLLW